MKMGQTNTAIYVKNLTGKTTEREEKIIIMVITIVILWCASVSGLN